MASAKKLKKSDSKAGSELGIVGFDAETEKFLKEIENCQNQIEALDDEEAEEILKVEQKFNLLRKPHFHKRAEIISKVPNFWLTAFNHHQDLSSMLEVGEEGCMKYLIKLEAEEFDDIKSGYRINFHFKENPYFENSVLTKEFQLESSDGTSSSLNTPIRWKESIDPTLTDDPTSGQLDQRSFFGWFTNHMDPTSDTIAGIIKDDLWQNPLPYFLLASVETESEEGEGDQEIIIEDDENETAG